MIRWLSSIALCFSLMACATIEGIQSATPVNPPVMRTYTPEGYAVQWWIYEEFDGSCTIEYAILDANKERVAKGVIPCQMMVYFFHGIQKRTTL